ncbi:MAG: dephospho-CoA kinase [Spirochaetales bacterium]|uniref:Dephospho-CoA kinase n=1 Tax=Candidatus Thalassospirochaeta sargassi TaxID=3119039 RepID=A0AAJ1MNM1_9SPIO|nr:dephospho-CoA kinase [Spirochaetales bacterium]
MVIGLTGKYCAGKNAAEAILIEEGIPSIDVDKLGHQALSANIERIEQNFGAEVIKSDEKGRSVNRRALGEIVFSDPAALKKLEAISHPWMKDETARLIKEYTAAGARHVIVNAAILHKMKLDELCDCIIWIEAPLCRRIRRGMNRDNTGLKSVLKRIYSQRQLKPKPSLNSVDIYRVVNGSDLDSLRRGLDAVISNIVQKGRDGR